MEANGEAAMGLAYTMGRLPRAMLDGYEVSISPNATRDRLTPDRNDDRFRAIVMGCRLPNQLNFHTSWRSTYRLTEPDALDTVLDIILSKGIGGQCRWRAHNATNFFE
jgi:hypothetical protein